MTGTAVTVDVFALLRELTRLQLAWSYEGTMEAEAEAVVRRVAATYGADAEVTILADSAILTVGGRTASFSRAPIVPPLDQVSDFKGLLAAIEDGTLTAGAATARLDALQRRPPRFSAAWQIFGLMLFAVGFGVSVQATGQRSPPRPSSACSSA